MNRCIFVPNFFILGCIQRISSQASGTPHNLKVTTRSPLWVFLPKRQKFHLEIWMESGKSKVLLSGKFKRRNDGNWKLDFFKAPICPPLPSAPLQPLKCLGSNLQNQCISSPLRSGRWGTPTPKNMVTEWGVFHCSWCVCAWSPVTLSCPSLLLQLHLLMKILPVELKSFILVGFHPEFTTTIVTQLLEIMTQRWQW